MKRQISLFFALAAVAACDLFKNPTDPTTPGPTPNTVNYTAVGASDAIGYGSSVVCLPFTTCPDGMGYVQVIGRRLKIDGKTLTLVNLGLPGGVLGPETMALGNSIGRDIVSNFLQQEVPFVPKNSTLVTVFAGGNDVNTVGAALEAGVAGTNLSGYVQTQTQNFGRDLQAMLVGILERAPQARVVVLNLPNMAGLPYAAGYTLDKKRWLQTISVGFSAQINALASRGALIIDVMCDSTFYLAGSYSADGFHPNNTGYAHLADIVYPSASTGSSTAPKSSCSQMALY
jgi:lysophospholipase L1-like esterase